MLCEKCQKHEATVHFCSATSSGSIVDGVYQHLGITSGPSRNLCPDCAEAEAAAHPLLNSDRGHAQLLKEAREKLPPFFTAACQKELVDRIGLQVPGILDIRLGEGKNAVEEFRDKIRKQKALFETEVVHELEKHGFAAEKPLVIIMVAELVLALLPRLARKRIAGRYPALSPAEIEAILFVEECVQAVLNGPRVKRYANVSGGEILAVAPTVAQKLYGAAARAELQKLGIVSSATMGEVIYRLIEQGRFQKSDEDHREDFQGKSPLDDFLQSE